MPNTIPRALLFLAGFAAALWLLGPLVHPPMARGQDLSDPHAQLSARLHTDVNAFRAQHHLIPLARRADLDRAALAHSRDMAARRYLSHDTPEGLNPPQRMERAGAAGFTLAGENVGMTTKANPNHEVLTGWKLSPVHRDNLLTSAFNSTGIGIARASDGTWYYTQVYATYPRN